MTTSSTCLALAPGVQTRRCASSPEAGSTRGATALPCQSQGPQALSKFKWGLDRGGKSFEDGKKLYTRCPHPPTAAKMAARGGT